MALGSWWLVIPFSLALVRALIMKPGIRPARIGAVEIVFSILIASFTDAALANALVGVSGLAAQAAPGLHWPDSAGAPRGYGCN